MIDQTPDYWCLHPTYKRPENDYFHPSMPTRKIGYYFGTIWYEILEDCVVMWPGELWGAFRGAHYHKGMIVRERRSKPLLTFPNYEWLRSKDNDKDNSGPRFQSQRGLW